MVGWRIVRMAVAALVAVLFFFPVYFMVASAFEDDLRIIARGFNPLTDDFQGIRQFTRAFELAPLATYLKNSMLLAVLNVSVTLIASAAAGYGFARFRFPGRTLLFFFVISTMMIPPQILVVPLFVEVRHFGWINSYPGLIIPGIMNAFGVFIMRQYCSDIPGDLIHAARADGAAEWQIFIFIVLPLLVPALVSLGIIVFIWTWGNFLWPLVAVSDEKLAVLATGITSYTQPYQRQPMWGPAMAVATIATVPMAAMLFMFQRHFVRGLTAAALKG